MADTSKSASRVSSIATQLREAIFEGKLTPGMPLRELTLARDFNVSQATVREALHRLEHAGLVTRTQNVGTTVTRLSPKDVRERVALRKLLETQAARAAAAKMTADDFTELERRLDALGAAIQSDSYYESAQADLAFHRYIWQCSGNETLCRMLELITVPLFAFISIMRSHGLQRLTAVVDEHGPLVEALRSRNLQRIDAAFEKGVTRSYDAFLDEGSERIAATAFGFLERAR